jgi:2-polyprenyl-3-methyl-5-hydroxy-6-metoxy-1,4-benzoquinol methylase
MQINLINQIDKQQDIFENYQVPDPIRIDKVVKFIRKYYKNVKGLKILECGISMGGVADILSKEGAECFGIDVNPREIKGVKIIKADLNNGLPEMEIEFDVIFAGEIVEHMFDDTKLVSECYKKLKSGGLFIATVPNLVSLFNRLFMFFGFMPLTAYALAPFHYHAYNRRTLNNLVKKEGFIVLKATSSYIPLYL